MTIHGSCHCGRVAFSADLEPTEAVECNCSICRRKGSLLAFVAGDKFTLETPREALSTYTFHKHVIRHQFCNVCGCAPFAESTHPDSGQPMAAINLRCVDDIDLSTIRIIPFDGASR